MEGPHKSFLLWVLPVLWPALTGENLAMASLSVHSVTSATNCFCQALTSPRVSSPVLVTALQAATHAASVREELSVGDSLFQTGASPCCFSAAVAHADREQLSSPVGPGVLNSPENSHAAKWKMWQTIQHRSDHLSRRNPCTNNMEGKEINIQQLITGQATGLPQETFPGSTRTPINCHLL